MDGIDSRPARFDQVISQNKPKAFLINSLKTGMLPRAILLSGPRGTGKTTLASLYARSILCENRAEDQSPCNKCISCRNFLNDCHSSYTEVDAANNGTKEDMSALLEALNYDFGTNRRIILIDEVHGISKIGKDALLKVMERPVSDDGTVFLMCTTEIQKMPGTLKSRCVQLPLERPTVDDVLEKLRIICDANDQSYDGLALRALAEWSQGHFRDAENALEPLVLMGGINKENVSYYTSHNEEATSDLIISLEGNLADMLNKSEALCASYGADTLHASIIRVLLEAIKYGSSGLSYSVSECVKNVYSHYGARMGTLLQHFTSKGKMTDTRFLSAELVQAHYKFVKGDMDFIQPTQTAAGMSQPKQSSSGGKKEVITNLSDQRAMKAAARKENPGSQLLGSKETESIWGQEKADGAIRIQRR